MAIVALLAPLAQKRYDDSVGKTDGQWETHRLGLCWHDRSAAQNAVKFLLPGAQQAELMTAYSRLDGYALQLLNGAGTWTRIELVANYLFAAGSLDEQALLQALLDWP